MAPSYRKHDGRVEAQTVREWVYEYEQGKPVWPLAWGNHVKDRYITVPDDFYPEFKKEVNQVEKSRVTFYI